jgi:hypothetical protein
MRANTASQVKEPIASITVNFSGIARHTLMADPIALRLYRLGDALSALPERAKRPFSRIASIYEVAPRSGTVFGGAKLEVRLLVVLYQAAKGSVCCCF